MGPRSEKNVCVAVGEDPVAETSATITLTEIQEV